MSEHASLLLLRERVSKALWDAGDTAKADEALMALWDRAEQYETALRMVFLDPLSSHGARALARETLGIPFIPFSSPEEMLRAHRGDS